MSRRALAVALVCAGLVVCGMLFLNSRRVGLGSVAPGDASSTPSSRARPVPPPAARAEAPRTVRRAPASAPAVEPEPAPAESAPELGTLRIETDVPGAQVFIDRQYVGATPLTATHVKPGTHQLNITAEGFDGIAQTIDVESGPRDLSFRFREVRLNATVAVVHKHRMGSCRGQLVATVDGIRYDTPDREDGFSVGLADLETFEIDYQDKNLRIRTRRGRQFDFTDPDGNADRLFVFHRDVQRARQRLGL